MAALAMVALAGGCGSLPSANLAAEEGVFVRPEQNSSLGGDELVLHPVAVWGEDDASAATAVDVGGREVFVRKRRGGWFDRARVKMGLFWNTRGDDVYLLVAVSGPPARIRAVRVSYDGGGDELSRARNVWLLPGRTIWDGGDGKSPAVYAVNPELLDAMLKSEVARVLVQTDSGVLELDLGVLQNDSAEAMRENAKVLFWQFYDKMTQMRQQ